MASSSLRVRHPLLTSAALAGLVLLAGACSDDSSSASTGSGGAQSTVADTAAGSTTTVPAVDPRLASVVESLVADAAEFEVTLDAACVEERIAQLSAADLELLAAWADDADPDATVPALSDEGEAIGEGLNSCVAPSDTTDGAVAEAADPEIVEQAVALVVSEEGDSADQDCLRANLGRLSNEQLQILLDEGSASDNPELDPVFLAVVTCLE